MNFFNNLLSKTEQPGNDSNPPAHILAIKQSKGPAGSATLQAISHGRQDRNIQSGRGEQINDLGSTGITEWTTIADNSLQL